MLPALLSSGVGALVFTGIGHWTGLETGALSLHLPMPFPRLDVGDVLWTIPLALAVAVLLHPVLAAARRVAALVSSGVVGRTVLCAAAAAACAALYALITGRSPAEVALSGQATLGQLATDPHAWGVGALVAVLLFKGTAYALCLGSLRGGLVFPALFLGAAAGVWWPRCPAWASCRAWRRAWPPRRPPPCGFPSAAWSSSPCSWAAPR